MNADRVTRVYGLSIPNVSVTLASPPIVVLHDDAREQPLGHLHNTAKWYQSLESKLRARDWRVVRDQFLSLPLDDRDAVADWLNQAGYIPTSALSAPHSEDGPEEADESRFAGLDSKRIAQVNRAWIAEEITRDIVDWLRRNREAIEWLLKLEHPTFIEAIDAAWTWLEQRRKELADIRIGSPRISLNKRAVKIRANEPSVALARKLTLPPRVDPDTLQQHLLGGGKAPALHAVFRWTRDGKPIVSVLADTPMVAISLSTHIDRNFSKLRLASCDYCHQSFTQKSPKQRFCSGTSCHDKWHNAQKAKKRELLGVNKRRKT